MKIAHEKFRTQNAQKQQKNSKTIKILKIRIDAVIALCVFKSIVQHVNATNTHKMIQKYL